MDPVAAALIHARANPGSSLQLGGYAGYGGRVPVIREPIDPSLFRLEGIRFETIVVDMAVEPEVLRELAGANTKDLRFNRIPNLDINILAETLRDNQYITDLRFWSCDIDDAKFALLAPNLPPNIAWLSVSFNEELHDVSPLARVLTRYPRLTSINASVDVPAPTYRQFTDALAARRSMVTFDMRSVRMGDPLLDWMNDMRAHSQGPMRQAMTVHEALLPQNRTALRRFLLASGDNAVMYRVLLFLLPGLDT